MRLNATGIFSLKQGYCSKCMSVFHETSKHVEVLFEGWKLSSTTVLVGSCVGVFLLSVLSECVRALRSRLACRMASASPSQTSCQACICTSPSQTNAIALDESDDSATCLCRSSESLPCVTTPDVKPEQPKSTPFSKTHFLQLILHLVQVLLGYILMLVVMTFDIWLGLAVVLGLGTGYYIFSGFLVSIGPILRIGQNITLIPLKPFTG